MKPTDGAKQGNGRDDLADEVDELGGMAEHDHPQHRPRKGIHGRKPALAGASTARPVAVLVHTAIT